MILSRFQWYRRMRGGYWAQITAPFGIFSRTKWVRCHGNPTPDRKWTFFPWASTTMGNGYIDEWYQVEPCWAVPYSSFANESIERLTGALQEICQIDDAKQWENGHTGKMNAMAMIARTVLANEMNKRLQGQTVRLTEAEHNAYPNGRWL